MDFLLIAFLTLLNGVFALSEMALSASRKARLAAMAESGDKGAEAALVAIEMANLATSLAKISDSDGSDEV